jgi:predicted N-formylglutamate amidohydrolase
VLLTCEHAGCRVPARYRDLFAGKDALLRSHRGWDPGAFELARAMVRRVGGPLLATTWTRLLVEANRSLRHRRLFSDVTRGLPEDERRAIVDRYWRPHREAVRREVARRAPVVHVGVHTFTPVLDGVERTVDVGFLYDPARPRERAFAGRWIAALAARAPGLRLRRNAPYRGNADGLTTALRREHRPARYLGVELEVNQRFPLGPAAAWRALRTDLAESLGEAADPALK